MKTTITVRLVPTSAQAKALTDTVITYSNVANYVSRLAWEKRVFRRVPLQTLAYGAVRNSFGLSAQLTILAIRRVADAYRINRSGLITFRTPRSATFDDRCLSWRFNELTVSISTVKGRVKNLQFRGAPHQVEMLQAYRKGEADLSFRAGKWFLHATCHVPEPPTRRVADVIGVDLGITNIAATSDGELYAGKDLNRRRRRYDRARTRLQSKGTKSARRLLKRRQRKEARMARDANHRISKRIVREAERTERGIAIEDLSGIRDRVTARKPQRRTLHSWSFAQLRRFITYKARLAGVSVVLVDPRGTSQECPRCGHISKYNRKTQDTFCCQRCGFADHADLVAAANIRGRGRAAVNQSDAGGVPFQWHC